MKYYAAMAGCCRFVLTEMQPSAWHAVKCEQCLHTQAVCVCICVTTSERADLKDIWNDVDSENAHPWGI